MSTPSLTQDPGTPSAASAPGGTAAAVATKGRGVALVGSGGADGGSDEDEGSEGDKERGPFTTDDETGGCVGVLSGAPAAAVMRSSSVENDGSGTDGSDTDGSGALRNAGSAPDAEGESVVVERAVRSGGAVESGVVADADSTGG